MAYFPFSGWKGSFFGVMHAQGRDAIEFFTDKKVIVERWPKEWSRKFWKARSCFYDEANPPRAEARCICAKLSSG